MNVIFNYHSQPARSARFAAVFTGPFQVITSLIVVGLLVAGGYLWSENSIVGATLAGIGIWISLPLVWYRLGLRKQLPEPLSADAIVVERQVDPVVVAHLTNETSTAAIFAAVHNSWQYRFFHLRYQIPEDFFVGIPDTPTEANKVWEIAHKLSVRHDVGHISVASILIGLLRILPDYQKKLADIHLDIEELETSVDWLHHTDSLRRRLGQKPQFGGIARDWTAGYTPQLNRMAHNMSLDIEHGGYLHRDVTVHSGTVSEMVQFISQPGRPNVALVGDTGSGKTTTGYAFAQRLLTDAHIPGNIRFHKVYMLDASTIIAQTSDANKVESVVLSMLAEAQHAKNIVLFMDEAHLFFSQGTGSVDLSAVLLPLIENSNVPLIMAFTPAEWQQLSAQNSHLTGMVNFLAVTEADEQQTLRVMEDVTTMLEARHRVFFTYQSLKEAYRVAERYNHDAVFPGRAIMQLEAAVNHAQNGIVTELSIQQSIEATRGVKVQMAGTEEKQNLLQLEELIHKRMVNQKRAVKVVSDALRRARSGVNNPDKPIGTFLFLGPTGVGKTELAKSIAATYFRSEDEVIRVDMNEYTQGDDSKRLLDPANEDGLIASVRRQPFSVVLFDEIEKAHPDIVNIFLQMLDEGVLRDANNKQTSFKDAVIIATSNAGADKIRKQISAGKQVEQFEEKFVNDLIDSGIFKPEFLNRFDESVVFRPLTPSELLKVVDLLMAGVNKTLKRQKIDVRLTDGAKKWLVEQGNDPRLGARPLRRVVQRTVENIIAKKMLDETIRSGAHVTLNKRDLEAEVS